LEKLHFQSFDSSEIAFFAISEERYYKNFGFGDVTGKASYGYNFSCHIV